MNGAFDRRSRARLFRLACAALVACSVGSASQSTTVTSAATDEHIDLANALR